MGHTSKKPSFQTCFYVGARKINLRQINCRYGFGTHPGSSFGGRRIKSWGDIFKLDGICNNKGISDEQQKWLNTGYTELNHNSKLLGPVQSVANLTGPKGVQAVPSHRASHLRRPRILKNCISERRKIVFFCCM